MPDTLDEVERSLNRGPLLIGLDALLALMGARQWGELVKGLDASERSRDWLRVLAGLWIEEQLRRVEQIAAAMPFNVPVVWSEERADAYGLNTKLMLGISWGIDAPGVPAVELDGDVYAPQPGGAFQEALVNPGMLMLPEDWALIPHQSTLPFEFRDQPQDLGEAMAMGTHYALNMPAAKLAILTMAADPRMAGKVHEATIGEVARVLNPGARIQKTHLRSLAIGLQQIRNFFGYLPNGSKIQFWDVPMMPWAPDTAERETEIAFGVHRQLRRVATNPIMVAGKKSRAHLGSYIINLTFILGIPHNRPGSLRAYLRGEGVLNSAFTGQGDFDPHRVPRYAIEDWAALNNRLPMAVVEYIEQIRRLGLRHVKAPPRLRKGKAVALKKAWEDLDYIHEMGGYRVEKFKNGTFTLRYTQKDIEAWRRLRKGGRRQRLLEEKI
jgi:hypothetical protein